MPKVASQQANAAKIIIAVILIFSLSYAILRYNILGDVPWKDLSFFVLNKSIALSAFILLSFNFSLRPLGNLGVKVPEGFINARRQLGMTAVVLVLIHVLMSFLIFNPANYVKFFEANGTITLYAGISMLGGILSFVVIWGYSLSFITYLRDDKRFTQVITSRNFLLLTMLLGMVHLFFMGFEGWLNPSGWHGGLPPISLLGFIFFMVSYIINVIGKEKTLPKTLK